MEGFGRVAAWAAVWVGFVCATGGLGCGDDESGAVSPGMVRTSNPERTFAPLIEIAGTEPWQPIGARWFIERSVLGFSGPGDCRDREIAVGHALPSRRTPRTDWIYPKGLGGWSWPAYYRNPLDENCELDFDWRLYANQLTRPFDLGPRIEGARPDEGFYLDLVDEARFGESRAGSSRAPVYVERTDEGDSRLRLTYWALYGMNGVPGQATAHEGDWESLAILLNVDGDRYEPVSVQVAGATHPRDATWSEVRRAGGTHAIVQARRATHAMSALPPGGSCGGCVAWKTWNSLRPAREELWYGFGGAWGELGATSAATGSLGPHGHWPTAAEQQRRVHDQESQLAEQLARRHR